MREDCRAVASVHMAIDGTPRLRKSNTTIVAVDAAAPRADAPSEPAATLCSRSVEL